MARFPLVGITGGVGCGKSEVGRLLAEMGVQVVDADEMVHDLLRGDSTVKRALVARFGDQIVSADGSMDRAVLADRVFADTVARRDLEGILHPVVRARLLAWSQKQRQIGPGAALVPLLFEAGFAEGWDAIWCVSADPDVVRARIRQRGWSDAQLAQRRAAQWPLADKEMKATCVLHNNGSRDELAADVRRAWDEVLKRSI